MLFVQFNTILFYFLYFNRILNLARIVNGLSSGIIYNFDVWIRYVKVSFECDLFNMQNLGINFGICQILLKVLNVLYLAWLGHTISILLEASSCVELQHIATVLKDSHKEKEAADDGASPSLAMIAVKNSDTLRICAEELRDDIANGEKHIERGCFMILPIKADNIFQHVFIDSTATQVNRDILALMFFLKQLCDGVNVISVKFLKSRSWEGHGYDSWCDIGQVQIISLLLESVLRAANYLTQKVHF